MNKERKILLIILFFSLVLSISFMNIFMLKEKRNNLVSTINVMEKQYEKLGIHTGDVSQDDIQKLKDMIELEKMRYFQAESTDPYRFGLEIKALLESNSLQVKGYKTLEQDDSFLIEFSVEGSSQGFFSFLKTIYEKEKNYRFPYFTIKNEKSGISSTFRIGYALYE